MNNEIDEVIFRSRRPKERMDFERLRFICYFIAGLTAEVLGFVLIFVIVLAMAGVLR